MLVFLKINLKIFILNDNLCKIIKTYKKVNYLKMSHIKNFKNLDYIKKVLFFNMITIIINLLILVYKICVLAIYKDKFLITSIIYSFLIILAKSIFNISKNEKNHKINKKFEKKCYLLMNLLLFIASISYLIYWIIIFITDENIIKFQLLKLVLYLGVYFIESISSIEGILYSNKNNDITLKGLKFVDLSIGLSALTVFVYIFFVYFFSFLNKYLINISGLLISVIMFINYMKKIRNS